MKTRVPSWLSDDGKDFWHAHFKEDFDKEAFALLCDLWAKWRGTKNIETDSKQAIRYMATAKQLIALMKLFGLFPEKSQKKQKEETQTKGEFDDL